MNPANFLNANGAMSAGVKPPGQMQSKNEMQHILTHVAQVLQNQGPWSDWRAEVQPRDRTFKVHQMITSLRLIQPQIELRSAASAAMSFENKAFNEAATKADYDREFNDKLVHIRDTRARHAAAMQGGMIQQGPPTGMTGVGQSPFPQQMSRSMQPSPMPGQQQMQMGMNNPNQQAVVQQRPQQSQQPQGMLQQQRPPQRPGGAAALNDDLNSLTPQEYDNVCRIATQILQKTSPDDMNKIKVNLQNMSPEQKVYLSKKGMDPITYFFRCQAMNHIRRVKRSRLEMSRNNQNNGGDSANALMGEPMINPQQQRQMFQNMVNMQQRNPSFSMGNQQPLDPSAFIGNVENIQGQQADGLRSQEAGQLVVPASSSQMNQQPFNATQNMFPVGQQMGQSNQVNINNSGISPQFLSQQHLPNSQAGPQDRTQQVAQFQSQSQNAQAQRAQAAQKAQMAMSQANMQQSIPQSPAMPMLNRPIAAPGQMSPAQAAAQVQPPSRQPSTKQHPANVPPMGTQQGMQNRPSLPANIPPHLQEQLARMSPEQRNAFFITQQRRMMANNPALARPNASQPKMAMQQGIPQSNQGHMINGQLVNPQNMRASLDLQQQLASMGGPQQSNQLMTGQQMAVQQRQQQLQQQQLHQLQLLRQQAGANMEMTPEEISRMDNMPFPPAILNNNPNAASIPKNIKSWGQLKQLAATSPQLLGGIDHQKLMTYQKYHLAQILKETNNRNSEQGGQAWAPVNFQGQPQSFMNPQQFQPGQQQAQFPMPQVRQITPQDLQMARQRFGAQVQNYTDDQLRDILRQKHIHAAQARAAQALANQHNQQSQAQGPPVSLPSATSHIKTEHQAQQQVPQQITQNQAVKAQNVSPAKPAKGSATKQTPPTSKRKLQGEETTAVQTSPVQVSTQPATSQGLPATVPSRPTMPITKEQLASMTPQQRLHLENQLRQKQGQLRGAPNRAAAEKAWSNLSENIQQLYNELAKNTPAEKVVAVTPEQRNIMNKQLRECIDYLGRLDALVQFVAKSPAHDKNLRNLLTMRIQLMRQFKPSAEWALNDHLTVTPEYLAGATNYIKKLFHHIARVNQQQSQALGQRAGASQISSAQQSNQNMAPLNASNLQQLQQQEEALQRARRASSQTAASGPSALPPAPFGAPSPQGVPHAYGPGSMPPSELKLPPNKRRKQSQPTTTPVSGPSGIKAPGNKQVATEVRSSLGAFKCSVPDCHFHYQGFATQDDLDKHVEENHKAEEPIEDALQFALQSFNTLIKDEQKPESQGLTKGFSFAATSLPAKQEVKIEGATPVSGPTPMGRVSSQLVTKPASPAPSQQLTPIRGAAKGPASSSVKPTSSRDGKKESRKSAEQDLSMAKDLWADSIISFDSIRDGFDSLNEVADPDFGVMDEFLNTEMFNGTQDTPDSVETGVATQTPKDGDVLKADEVISKNPGVTVGSWLPADWSRLPSQFEDALLKNEACEEIDWDMIDLKGGTMGADDNGIAIFAM
ncbi:uncharacterized protein DSM5745_00628 [Aspergillus mulundensis]|uniref:Mediator complex subunit 15 KIX domain-containing protein n=1 Tax=Aspergillus mulundensis TaxID=1810919 RepID=A0A3D8T421_9EURO|nr:Uncharacterized protein DSM5745_00628 [Aspergillus mulundensis]RDW93306.1 Uncharacterized protein DSM5745_00628 [Aspergillus mulundensis]